MNNNIKIEIHLLQNFAPSCLNRDDSNTPKDCEFGGVRRARISSQCIKRAIKMVFDHDMGIRTKNIKDKLLEKLEKQGQTRESIIGFVDEFIETYYAKLDKQKDKTSILLYLSEAEICEAVNYIIEIKDASKKITKEKSIQRRLQDAQLSEDIALFGRMITENPDMNRDASCQVAHALSTHRVDLEMDFYTAVDDLNNEGDLGAGMMGVTGYNSACFYRYSLLDHKQLIDNLSGNEEIAANTIRGFLEASVKAIPTGKQNSFAAQNLPSFGLFIVKKDGMPCSLANAFVKPVYVKGEKDDLVGKSIESLAKHYESLTSVYGEMGEVKKAVFHTGYQDSLGVLDKGSRTSLEDAIEAVMEGIREASGLVEG